MYLVSREHGRVCGGVPFVGLHNPASSLIQRGNFQPTMSRSNAMSAVIKTGMILILIRSYGSIREKKWDENIKARPVRYSKEGWGTYGMFKLTLLN